jgi:hypothetical protein
MEVPGFRQERLLALMRAGIDRCRLDLTGCVVLTEAASGAYVVTPVLAAMAGATRVLALTRDSRYGTADKVAQATMNLATKAAVADRIQIVTQKTPDVIVQADVITNSGHLRPIDAATVTAMKPAAVIPLMYEAWEFRPDDLDLMTCRGNWIPVVGTNERHPAIDVFSFLGMMAIQLLLDAGIAVYGSRILLCCDNPFREFVERGLTGAGAVVQTVEKLDDRASMAGADAVLIAMTPRAGRIVGDREAVVLARLYPDATIVQFFGDLDRAALARCGVPFWPLAAPASGHQGILPSRIGPEPIVRLQCGGLKVGEVMARARRSQSDRQSGYAAAVAAAVDSGFGQRLFDSLSGQAE